jgi:DNA-binding CsgD family transcriptional regulator
MNSTCKYRHAICRPPVSGWSAVSRAFPHRQEIAVMTPSDAQDIDLFARGDPQIALTADDQNWTISEDTRAPSSIWEQGLRSVGFPRAEGQPRVADQAPGRALGRVSGSRPRQEDVLSRFIGNIYNAALDSAMWPEVLAAIAGYVGGQAAGLVSKNSAGGVCTVHHQFGFDAGHVQLYMDEYWRMDPLGVSVFFPTEQPTTVEDYVPHDEFREGRFYREWGQPQGWIDAVSVVLEKSPTNCSSIVVARHETRGLVDRATSARMGHIGPHIRRAVQISKLVDVGQAESATFAAVFDGLSAGVFLVDAGARIAHANLAGRAILTAEGPLSSVRGRLVARDSAIDQALRAALATVAKGDPEIGDGAIVVPLTSEDNERYVAHLLPLTSGAGPRAGISGKAVAALFVHKAAMDRPSLPESVARHYKLTPTELRVLLGIVEVGGAPEVADALGIADNTVKTHLGRVYQKTGTRRQADLVKLVAGFSTPLIG